ncbi:MAG: biotin transporter BioY [Methanoregula sp.]|jgi:biotin transport system substrate-specific component
MFGNLKRSRIIALSAVFIALIALGSWVSVPFFPVPLTLQTLFVLLAGAVMRRYAVIPVTLYILLGALGLPVFHNGIAGIGILLGPTGGYLAGFIPAALIAGLAYEVSAARVRVIGLAATTVIIYACGISWLMYSTDMGIVAALSMGMVPFLPGDLIKGSAAYLITKRLS